MSLMIDLPTEIESTVLAEAERRGLGPSDYLKELILDSQARLPLAHLLHDLISSVRQLELLAFQAESRRLEFPPGTVAAEITLLSRHLANLFGALTPQSPLSLSLSSFNLLDLVHETVELFSFRAEQHAVTFKLQAPEQPLLLRSDRSKISRLLSNVLDNAIQYSAPAAASRESIVLLRAHRRDIADTIELNVTSCGIGNLSEEIESRAIFEYGRRGTLARAVGRRGSGIGLAEAQRIATALGARILVDSKQLDDGRQYYKTSVKLVLPQASGDL